MKKAGASRIARRKRRFRHRSTIGTIPGTMLVHESSQSSAMRIIHFDSQTFSDEQSESLAALSKLIGGHANRLGSSNGQSASSRAANKPSTEPTPATPATAGVVWINIDGLSDTRLIKHIGDLLGLHPLALEDVVNVHQRAKVEIYGETLFCVVRMPVQSESGFHTEQVSLFLCGNVVLSLQESAGDCLDALRHRIRLGLGRIRTSGADYLLYAIVDAIVDGYFTSLQNYGEALDALTASIGERGHHDVPLRLHEIRECLLGMRRVVRQHRDAFQILLTEPHEVIAAETRLYFRDCLDHINQLLDAADADRETCAELRELYFAMLGQRNNDVMKVLAVVSTIFIPMSFVAGVYGMNFDRSSPYNMPELGWRYGYPAALGVMLSMAFGLFLLLKRKGWL